MASKQANRTAKRGTDMLSVRLMPGQRPALKRLAADKETTVQVLVRQAIADLLRGRRAPRGVTE